LDLKNVRIYIFNEFIGNISDSMNIIIFFL